MGNLQLPLLTPTSRHECWSYLVLASLNIFIPLLLVLEGIFSLLSGLFICLPSCPPLAWPRPCGNNETCRANNNETCRALSLIHISEPTRLGMISYAVFCLKKKKKD